MKRLLAVSTGIALLGLTACGGGTEPTALEWQLATPPASTDTHLMLNVRTGNCMPFDRVQVRSQPDAVIVTAVGRKVTGDCTTELLTRLVDVPLEQPLGERRIERGDL